MLASYEGRYALESEEDFVVTVRAGEGVLLIDVPDQGTFTLHAEVDQPDRLFDASDGQSVSFERADEGSIAALVLPGDARLVRR